MSGAQGHAVAALLGIAMFAVLIFDSRHLSKKPSSISELIGFLMLSVAGVALIIFAVFIP